MISPQKYFKNFKCLDSDYGQPDVAMLYAKKIIIDTNFLKTIKPVPLFYTEDCEN